MQHSIRNKYFTLCHCSQKAKKKILDAHNKLRQMVASGQATGLNGEALPAAEDMMELKWDDQLAAGAQM